MLHTMRGWEVHPLHISVMLTAKSSDVFFQAVWHFEALLFYFWAAKWMPFWNVRF